MTAVNRPSVERLIARLNNHDQCLDALDEATATLSALLDRAEAAEGGTRPCLCCTDTQPCQDGCRCKQIAEARLQALEPPS